MSTRTPSPEVAKARGRIGGLVRDRASDDPELIDARRDLASAKLYQYIEQVVSTAPPLTSAQVNRLTGLFNRPEPRVLRRHASVDEHFVGGDA